MTNLRAADDSIKDSSCEEMKISGGKVSHSVFSEGLRDRLDLYILQPSAETSLAPNRAWHLEQ